ncbi:MAG: cytochrome c [Thermoanaerobaculia bacterium]|nr:cytochrome c [Thermoanaerobaculia bacterium]
MLQMTSLGSSTLPLRLLSSISSSTAATLMLVGIVVPTTTIAAETRPEPEPTHSSSANQAQVDLGRYLVTVAGCNDCHTPLRLGESGPEPDLSRMLSGHPEEVVIDTVPQLGDGPWGWMGSYTNTAFAGPWGVSFATNLTPDENTGLGIWTEDIFVEALRSGRHWGQSRPILPPMPWPNLAQMTDEDLSAVFAYLRSVPAITNRVPEPLQPVSSESK